MPTNKRQGELARAVFEALTDHPKGLPKSEVRKLVQERLPPTSGEMSNPRSVLGQWTIGLARAGWLIKNNGHWSVTNKGRAAYARYPDPEALQHKWNRLYHDAVRSHNELPLTRAPGLAAPRTRTAADSTPQEVRPRPLTGELPLICPQGAKSGGTKRLA